MHNVTILGDPVSLKVCTTEGNKSFKFLRSETFPAPSPKTQHIEENGEGFYPVVV
jgi:hypothetical protein